MVSQHRTFQLVAFALLIFLMPSPAFTQQAALQVKWVNYTTADGLPSDRVLTVAVDGERVWAGTDSGLALIENGKVARVFKPEDGLANRVVTGIAVDKNTGDVWIATFGGLSRFSGGVFQNYGNLTSGLANDIVYDVGVKGSYVWAVTTAGISRLNTQTGEWSNFNEENTPMTEALSAGVAIAQSRLYFSVWGNGVLVYDLATGKWKSYRDIDETAKSGHQPNTESSHKFVTGLAYNRETHTLWVATNFGLSTYDGRVWRNYPSIDEGLTPSLINRIQSRGHEIWACTDDGLKYLDVRTGTWTTFRRTAETGSGTILITKPNRKDAEKETPTSLSGNRVLNVAFQGRNIWVATTSGLSYGIWSNESGRSTGTPELGRTGILHPQSSVTEGLPANRAIVASQRAASASEGVQNAEPTYSSSRSVATVQNEPVPDSVQPQTVNIGFFGPVENGPEIIHGTTMLHGAQLAIEEANDRGGYRATGVRAGIPYALKVHNDSAQWGVSSAEVARTYFDEHWVAAFGLLDGAFVHTMLQISSKLEFPIVDVGTTDPTVTETGNPWLLHNFPDDRQQAHALVDYIFNQLKLRRIGLLYAGNRYGRIGSGEFVNESHAIANTIVSAVKFQEGDTDFSTKLQALRRANIDGLVIWGELAEAAAILKQMRAIGMRQPVFGPSNLADWRMLGMAGPAGEGLVTTSAMDPVHASSKWKDFQRNYRKRFDEVPDSYAAYLT